MSKDLSKIGVSTLLQKSLEDLGIKEATDIQEQVIPIILNSQKDIVALSKTGTGKTVAFGLPLIQLVNTQSDFVQTLILSPTRELSQQIYNQLIAFAKYLPDISIALITGGVSIQEQRDSLSVSPQIIVATPGRFLDLLDKNVVDVKQLNNIVLDEADEMFQALKEVVDRKSTRLNSSHVRISYAVFC